jgi:hypothetical protein
LSLFYQNVKKILLFDLLPTFTLYRFIADLFVNFQTVLAECCSALTPDGEFFVMKLADGFYFDVFLMFEVVLIEYFSCMF